jgi:hypothetical protein
MRFLILLALSGLQLIATAQEKYHCQYTGKVSFPYPDSVKQSLRKMIEEKGFPASVVEQLVEQVTSRNISSEYLYIVDARPDSTFILTKKNEDDESENKMSMPTQLSLFYKGEIYKFDSGSTRFSVFRDAEPPKTFVEKGEVKTIMGHICKGYISADTSWTIWVTQDLPSYINPGIRTGSVKGAVLAFRRKVKETIIEAEIDEIEKKNSQGR